ncbi:MAG: hypothetical protein DWG76_05715 [Chloroflexi bacterium]|nr:hypothetical protein [Chloroflexota bacterium]
MKRTFAIFALVLLLAACAPGEPAGPPVQEPAPLPAESAAPLATNEPAAPQAAWVEDGIILQPADLGVPEGMPVADVSAYNLPDGRIRLYAFAQEQGVRSLVSEDGVAFTLEDGVRVDGGMPRVVQLEDGSLRLFFISAGGIGSAVSEDGLTFTVEPGLRLSNADAGHEITPLAIIPLAEGGFRAYFSDLPRPGTGPDPHQVYSAVSEDMLTWTIEEGVRIGVGSALEESAEHPAALLNADGSVTLYTCNNRAEPSEGGPTVIREATSADGLTFTESTSTYLVGCDPDILVLPDGGLRLFYGNFDAAIGGYILSAHLEQ